MRVLTWECRTSRRLYRIALARLWEEIDAAMTVTIAGIVVCTVIVMVVALVGTIVVAAAMVVKVVVTQVQQRGCRCIEVEKVVSVEGVSCCQEFS